jgi:hypothetical protein
MPNSTERRDIFISHSSNDQRVAADLVSRLEASGVSCWIAPRDVSPGVAYADALFYALEAALVLVVLMSKAANDSDHVKRELTIADQMGKRIVPVQVEDFEATGAFCYFIRPMQFYPWRRDPEGVVARIVRELANGKAGRNLS